MAEVSKTAKFIAEFVGTFILVFTIGCNLHSDSGVWAGVSIAASLMVGIYALAPISGANFNPAVSVALALSDKLTWKDCIMYVVAQFLAGFAGLLSYSTLFGSLSPVPSKEFTLWQAGFCELLYTFMLCFVVLNTAASYQNAGKHQFYGSSIGFVIVAGAYGAGAVSGGCFNPAVVVGIGGAIRNLYYMVFQIAGAALAAGLYKVVRPKDFDKEGGTPAGLPAKLTSEFLGTYMLVLTVGLNVLAKSQAAALSIAASLMCMIYSLGDVSGGHFNPAVTVAILTIGGIKPKEAAIYMGTQILGGVLAALTYTSIRHKDASFPLGPMEEYSHAHASVAEAFFTFLLCFTVLSVACSPSAAEGQYSELFALAIGACITVGGFAIGNVSGGSLNPAVSFGIAAGHAYGQSKFVGFGTAAAYSVSEFIGAGAAAGLYFVTHKDVLGQDVSAKLEDGDSDSDSE